VPRPDEDDLLHVDEDHWVRRKLPVWTRLLGLVGVLATIAGVVQLLVQAD
jgi:hypothetical protein